MGHMTLPYPYEVELGLMKPPPWMARTPFDVQNHLERAIRVAGAQLEVFGTRLDVPASHNATAIAKRFRNILGTRLQSWRPDADAETWRLFDSQARAEMVGLTQADDETLRMLLLTVSGL